MTRIVLNNVAKSMIRYHAACAKGIVASEAAVPAFEGAIAQASLLTSGETLDLQSSAEASTIAGPARAPGPLDTVIALETDAAAEALSGYSTGTVEQVGVYPNAGLDSRHHNAHSAYDPVTCAAPRGTISEKEEHVCYPRMSKITLTALKQHLRKRSHDELIGDIADLFTRLDAVKDYYALRLRCALKGSGGTGGGQDGSHRHLAGGIKPGL